MISRKEETITRHKKGYNCAQAVACTYCDLVGMDEETMFKATEALGGGLGTMEGTCGAVVGACVVAGLCNSTGNLEKPDSKAATGKLSREISRRFMERNQTVTCKVLKGVGTGEMIRTCPDCIRDAAEFLEQVVFAEK